MSDILFIQKNQRASTGSSSSITQVNPIIINGLTSSDVKAGITNVSVIVEKENILRQTMYLENIQYVNVEGIKMKVQSQDDNSLELSFTTSNEAKAAEQFIKNSINNL